MMIYTENGTTLFTLNESPYCIDCFLTGPKRFTGPPHPDRDTQFQYIQVDSFTA